MTSSEAAIPADPPWLSQTGQAIASGILSSFEDCYGRPLLAGLARDASTRLRAQELFRCSIVVLAHDGYHADEQTQPGDPLLIYANQAALQLWRRPWGAMVGMPSRLTAEAEERQARAAALQQARQQQAISGYAGIRIDSSGRRFRIEAARLWSLPRGPGCPGGQAAAFDRWWWLSPDPTGPS